MTRSVSLLPAFALLLVPCTAQAADTCHTGAYTLSDGSELVVQPSDADNLRYRFLDGTSGRLYRVSKNRYETGDGWAVREPVTLRLEFSGCDDGIVRMDRGPSPALQGRKMTPVDFVVVSYGLAVSMLEEDRLEVAQSLRMSGYGPEVLAKGEQLHRAAAKVMMSRFSEGLDELERLKAAYRSEPWFEKIGGDFTSPLVSTPADQMSEVQALFDFPYDLAYGALPTLKALDTPQLWILAGDDTEAPHEPTLAVLRQLESQGAPIEVAVFPDAEHGMIAVEQGPEGRRLAGRTAEGYFELLFDWIGTQANRGSDQAPAGS